MMLNPKKAAKLIRQHFEELTTEQFVENLRNLSHEVELELKTKDQPRQTEAYSLSGVFCTIATRPPNITDAIHYCE